MAACRFRERERERVAGWQLCNGYGKRNETKTNFDAWDLIQSVRSFVRCFVGCEDLHKCNYVVFRVVCKNIMDGDRIHSWFSYGHTHLKAPGLVRSPKLSK